MGMDARFARAGTYLVIAVSMAVAVGAGAFVAGRGTADVDGAFDEGWAAGEASARRAANERYGAGGAGREAIRDAAYRRGRVVGLKAGRREGFRVGRRAGIRIGEQAVFAGFGGRWQVGGWYAVRIGQGEGVRGYSIAARRPLRVARSRAVVRPASVAAAGTGGSEAR